MVPPPPFPLYLHVRKKKQEDETFVFITGRGKRADIGESYFTTQKSKRLSHWYVIKHWRRGGDRFLFRIFSFWRHFHILAFFLAFVILVVAASVRKGGGEVEEEFLRPPLLPMSSMRSPRPEASPTSELRRAAYNFDVFF